MNTVYPYLKWTEKGRRRLLLCAIFFKFKTASYFRYIGLSNPGLSTMDFLGPESQGYLTGDAGIEFRTWHKRNVLYH